MPRDVLLRIVELNVGSAELFRGVCIPDGVDVPLRLRLCENNQNETINIYEGNRQHKHIKMKTCNEKKHVYTNA